MSEPFCVEMPSLSLQGSTLVADPGAFASDSGPVHDFVFAFYKDGIPIQGEPPPKSTADLVPGANVNTCPFQISGRYAVSVWGAIHSVYVGAYDRWEYGHYDSTLARNPATAYLDVSAPSAPPPTDTGGDVNTQAHDAVWVNITKPNIGRSTWAKANPRERDKVLAYLGNYSAEPPKLATSIGRALVGLGEQLAWIRGVHP